jgi:hypothetical protein
VLARARRRPASLDPRASRRCLVTPHDSVSPRKFRQETEQKGPNEIETDDPPTVRPPARPRPSLYRNTSSSARARKRARSPRASPPPPPRDARDDARSRRRSARRWARSVHWSPYGRVRVVNAVS